MQTNTRWRRVIIVSERLNAPGLDSGIQATYISLRCQNAHSALHAYSDLSNRRSYCVRTISDTFGALKETNMWGHAETWERSGDRLTYTKTDCTSKTVRHTARKTGKTG